jgi:hypothetical protein
MKRLPNIDVYGDRGQCMVMLLAALSELRAIRTKQEVLAYIQHHHWFDIQADDWNPYPSQTEPKWHTMIAWARKDCVERGWMFDHDELDSWEATRSGLKLFEKYAPQFETAELDVSKCYLWSTVFKRRMCSRHQPSSRDLARPRIAQLFE